MKWELLGTGIGVAAIGLTLMVALPPPWWPKMPAGFVQAGIVLGLVLLVVGIGLTELGAWPGIPAPKGPYALMIFGTALFITGGVWFFFSPAPPELESATERTAKPTVIA